jgi:hypothetical protein
MPPARLTGDAHSSSVSATLKEVTIMNILRSNFIRNNFKGILAASAVLFTLPAAKSGCGPDVPIGSNDCGGLQGLQCQTGEYCHIEGACGAADEIGECRAVPEACPEIYGPVCGCDGITYSNDCFAHGAGVNVASNGECGTTTPTACGGLNGSQCATDEFCNYANQACGAADDLGECEPRPEACDLSYDPVCGCDGQVYGNECEANAAGVSLGSDGLCGITNKPCGGFQGLECDPDEYCDYADQTCGTADELGECIVRPEVCPEIFAPVCGCDAVTYSNECEAHSFGTSILGTGECLTN